MWIRLLILLAACEVALCQSADEYLRQASHLVVQYQWNLAATLLRSGLEQHPDNPELLLQLGNLLVRSGKSSEGEALLQRALELRPDDHEILRSTGEAQLRLGKYSSAIELLRQSLKGNTSGAEAHHRLAFALLAKGDDKSAIEHARRSVELNPLDARFRRLYALVLETQQQSREAYEQLKLVSSLTPRDPHLLFQLSEKRRLAGALFQSLEYLELAVEIDPENPLYHDKLATLYERLNERESAAEELKLAQDLRTAFERYIDALKLSTRGRRTEAIEILQPIVQTHEEFVTGMMLLADLYQKTGEENKALSLYLKVIERDPFQSSAREKGAWIQARRGLFESALRLLKQPQFQTPNRTLIAAYRSLAQEDWASALVHFRQVEIQNPLNPELLQLISFCLSAQGKNQQALSHLAKAEKLRPNDLQIRRQRREIKLENAMELISQKRWRAALNAFQELMKEDVQAEYFLNIAYCLQQLGELKKAVENYRTGLEIDADAHWAQVNFASSLYRTGEYQEAATQWELILKRSRTPDAYYQLGLCYSHLDRFPEAEIAFEKATELGDQRPEVLYNLGLSRLRLNRPQEAWHLIRRAARCGYPPARELVQQQAR